MRTMGEDIHDREAVMAKWKELDDTFVSTLGIVDTVEPTVVTNMVDRPPHYNNSDIECIDAMKAMADGSEIEPHAAYCWQNAFKYLWRWPYKHKPIEDLKKARWYLDRLIKELEDV